MKLPRRRFLHLAAGAAALPAVSRVARAQVYPSHPITIVVPFPAGGPSDLIGRLLAEHMKTSLGQPVITENVSGAAGSIGVGRVARAAPDGYTLSIGQWGTHVVNGAIFALPYDVVKDFEPISLISSNPAMIVAKKALPADDLEGLIAWLKANPDKASQGTQGVGSVGHVFGAFFQNVTGTRFQFVPYRGSAPALQDLVSGQIDLMFDNPITPLPHVRAGNIKAYAITGKSRLATAPNIPTADEAGLSGFYASNWFALFGSAGTPKDIIVKLNGVVMSALADPAIRRKFTDLGHEISRPDQQTPEALAALQKADIEQWWPILKAATIKAE